LCQKKIGDEMEFKKILNKLEKMKIIKFDKTRKSVCLTKEFLKNMSKNYEKIIKIEKGLLEGLIMATTKSLTDFKDTDKMDINELNELCTALTYIQIKQMEENPKKYYKDLARQLKEEMTTKNEDFNKMYG
jgi:hypothetical protein